MDAGKLLANFDLVIAAPGGVARVREMILQLAVRGQLVPQDPSDGAAAIVLENARREKAKIKVAKSMPPVDAPSALYSLPQNWEWMRIGDAGRVVGGGTPKTSIRDYWEGDEMFSWITPADLNKQSRYVEKGRRDISRAGLENSSANILPVGSVVFSIRAPIGYVGIVSNPLATNQGFKSCVPYIQNMSDYIWLFLKAFAPSIDAAASGTTFRELSGKEFSLIPIAVPPIAEQKRIVAKVDELMALCDELDEKKQHRDNTHKALQSSALNTLATAATPASTSKAWTRIHDHWPTLLSTPESIATLRQTILQLAIRGQLVPQNAKDAQASLVIGEIKLQMEKMIEAGEIKAKKPLPALGASELLFEPPPGWTWSRLGDYCHVEMGQSPASAHYNQQGDGIPFFQGKADFGSLTATARYWCTKPTKLAQAGDVLLSVRAPVGPTNFAVEECCIGRGLAALRPLAGVPSAHILWTIRAFEADLVALGTGTTFVAISRKNIENFPIPIPPLAEQKRIAAKIDELMALCDALEARIGDQSATSRDLARALSASA